MYAAMPADETLSANQRGVPYTWTVAVSGVPPLRLALMVAAEPVALAVAHPLWSGSYEEQLYSIDVWA